MEAVQLIKIANKFLELNPSFGLAGSLMLYIRGISLNRPIGDIDIVGNENLIN